MNRTNLVLALICSFCIGCTVASTVLPSAPPARAAQHDVQRWAYRCFEEDDTQHIVSKANQYGAQGWEMVAASLQDGQANVAKDAVWCFKRPR